MLSVVDVMKYIVVAHVVFHFSGSFPRVMVRTNPARLALIPTKVPEKH